MQAPAARLRAARSERADDVRSLGAAAFSAVVDLGAVEPGQELKCEEFDHETILTAPGLELRIDVNRVAWHASPTAITLVLGGPQVDGRAATAEDVDRALLDAVDPWSRFGERFALARIDLAASEALLATDRFGVWPLAWARDGSRLAFSDRADRVQLDDAPPALDPQALFDYVYFHMIPAPRTVFRGVARLEPARAVHFTPARTRTQVTWQPPAPEAARARPPFSAFQAAVETAVRDAADGAATGCFLSGGTDSSTVAGMLARAVPGANSFSIGFDADGYDEMAYARIAARHFGTTHHEYYVTPDDLVPAVPLVARHYDQPFGNSSAVPAYYCARMARHHGVERVLAGDGGDELFGGNVRYAKQKLFDAYGRVPAALRTHVAEPLLRRGRARTLPGVGKLASYVEQARVPMPARMETYNLLERFGAAAVFDASFLAAVDRAEPAALQDAVYRASAGRALVDRMLAYDWRFTLADNDLVKVTGTTQLAGLAVRFPLLADAVVDLSLQLDARDKVRRLRLRHYFKQALAGFLPPEILAKKKHGFGLPVGPWLVTNAAFRGLAYEALNALADRRLIQRALVVDLFSRRLEEHPGYYGEMVWILMVLEHWMRAHAPSWSWR